MTTDDGPQSTEPTPPETESSPTETESSSAATTTPAATTPPPTTTDSKPSWWESWWPFQGKLASTLQAEHQGLPYLGFRIFKWLLALTVLLLAVLVAYGWLSYPSQSDYVPSTASATKEQWQAYNDAQAAWVTNIKDLGQLFLLTPIFPLIGAVIGYIFGKQETKNPPDTNTDM